MIRKYICIALSLAMVLTAFSGCEQKSTTQKLKLNEVVHSVFYAPQYVALEKGFFSEVGLEIELSVGQGADTQVTQWNVSKSLL